MPRIFDNIENKLLPAVQETLSVADRALDSFVAHLYGLTEAEFTYSYPLPLGQRSGKIAAQNACRDVERGLIK